jgi:hypothetical protein
VQFTVDFQEHLIKMPFVANLWSTASQLVSRVLAEFLTPVTDCLIGEYNPTLGQQLFDIAITEGEALVEPHRVTDDLGRKAVTLVRGQG